MAIPGEAPAEFAEILKKLWWPLDMALDEDAVAYSALVCLIDAIKHGTTTLFDQVNSDIPHRIELGIIIIHITKVKNMIANKFASVLEKMKGRLP